MKLNAMLIPALSLAFAPAGADEQTDDEHHQFEEIIVAATPLERTVEQLAQPTAVLAGDALLKRQAPSIGETLASELGVNATYFGPVASRPVIRGQFGERVRVLSNGLDSLDASALSEDHAVSVDSILAESVEVVRGPATLLYGSGAAGGLVNVVDSRIARAPLEKPFSGALALAADDAAGMRSAAAKVDFGTETLALHLDAFRRETDDVETPVGEAENTASEADGGAAALAFTGSAGHIGVSVSRHNSNYGVPGEHHGEEEEPGAAEEEEAVSIDLEQTRFDLDAGYDVGRILERVELRVARNDYRHVELEGTETGTRFDTNGTDLRLELRHRPWGKLEGAIGIQSKTIDFKAEGEEAFVPSSDTSQFSIFAFEELGLGENWVLQGSARFEHQGIETPGAEDYDESAAGASIGVIHSFSDNLRLSANLALTERHPNATELFADGPHVAVQRYERGSYTLDESFLEKEQSTNLDVTLRGTADRFEWTVTGFINDVDDYVLLAPTDAEIDGLQVFDYQQTDVEMYGAEAEMLVDLFEDERGHLHARLFGDFVRGEEKVTGYDLPRLPPLRWGLGLHLQRDRLDASIEATRNTEQDRTAPNELPTPAFTMLNAEFSYRFDNPDLLVYVRGTNLGDDTARRHTSPLKELLTLPGRSLHVGMRLYF